MRTLPQPALPPARSLRVVPTGPTTPPFPLPAEHFALAALALGLGGLGLIRVAPLLARGDYLAPAVLATTHLFTLGWITATIFGALYQLFPAMLRIGIQSIRWAHAGFWCYAAGLMTLVLGFAMWRPILLGCGWGILFLAVGIVAWNLLPGRRKAGPGPGQLIGYHVSGAHMALGLAMAIAAARIGESLAWWSVPRLTLIHAHFHLAAVGFASITIVGFGSRMLPMFLGPTPGPEWPLRWVAPLAGIGSIVFAAGQLTGTPALTLSGAALMVAAAVLYLTMATGYYRRRSRPLDPAMAHVAAALLWLAAAAASGPFLLWASSGRREIGYAIMLLLGWLSQFVMGISYRILPALTLQYRFAGRPGRGTPSAARMSPPLLGWLSLAGYNSGLIILVAGIWSGNPRLATPGAVLTALGIAVVVLHDLRLAIVGHDAPRPAAGA